MRILEFAIACPLSCFVFFGGAAPVNYDPHSAKASFEPQSIRPAEADTVPATENEEIGEQGNLGTDTPAPDGGIAKKPTSLERAKAALAESSATALSDQELCATLVEVARRNELPLGFFTNLIWRESRFDHDAISPVGAMGIAQFMPDVADKLSLDAFDSRSALPASARLLQTLRARFGNLGLAAAAYNAGPKRVSDWLAGRSALPKETQDYVHIVTGRPAAHWLRQQTVVYRVPRYVPCHRSPSFASAEQAERMQQERIIAEQARLAEQKIREAARRQKEEKEKHKTVARTARLQIASRVQAAKSSAAQRPAAIAAQRPAKIRFAQVKR